MSAMRKRKARSTAELAAQAVLVVDDDETCREITAHWLRRAGMDCRQAADAEGALAYLIEEGDCVEAIVLDVLLPGVGGFELLRRVKHSPRWSELSVLTVSGAATDDADVVHAIELGALDHLRKPFSEPVLVAKVRAACDATRNARLLRARLRTAEASAAIDPLTGLYNRRQLHLRLSEEASAAKRQGKPLALVVLDLDEFKSINDRHGHLAGDRVLVHVADALRRELRGADTAYRYGGEEFVLLLPGCDAENAAAATERIRQRLAQSPLELAPGTVPVAIRFSAGAAATLASSGFIATELLGRADAALYAAKRAGRSRTEIATT